MRSKKDPRKIYLDANDLMRGSIALGRTVYDSGFFYHSSDDTANNYGYLLNFLGAVWRGGTPVGIYVNELLRKLGIKMYHVAVKTESYKGIEQRGPVREVVGLDFLVERILASRIARAIHGDTQKTENLLWIDDVFDTGQSLKKIIENTEKLFKPKAQQMLDALGSYLLDARFDYLPNMKIATVYYKPERNETEIVPDFYKVETDAWIVFPHELEKHSLKEIEDNKDPIFSAALRAANFEQWAKPHLKLPK